MENIEKLPIRPFTRFCMSIGAVPSSYLAGLTIEEQLLWLCSYLEKQVIPAVNNNGEAVEELQNLFTELQTYVNNYFDNLDVQEEINTKLDEMAESGELEELIAAYINTNALICFDKVSDMKAAENLVAGSYVKTLGYYTINDGGAATYKIREITNADVVNEKNIIALHDNNLIAEIIVENNTININQYGAKSDDDSIDTAEIINLINEQEHDVLMQEGNYYISTPIFINAENGTIKGNTSKSVILISDDFVGTDALTVYSEDGDYYTKQKRQQTIENITISGTDTQLNTINGLKIGGDTGTTKEGHIDLVQFNNIYLHKLNKAIIMNSHAYKLNFYNIVFTENNYSIYSDDNQTDQNESTNFYGSAFWSGCIYSKMNINFIGCTLHFNMNKTIKSVNCYAYFDTCLCNFTNCHFEDINRLGTETLGLENVFVSYWSILNFDNCNYLITGTYEKITDSFFKTINATETNRGRIAKINVNNADMKYLLNRINKDVPQANFTLCKGEVTISSMTKYIFDTSSFINYKIYDTTTNFTTNGATFEPLIKDGGFSTATISESEGVITISGQSTTNTYGLFKKIPVGNHKAVNIKMDVACDKANVHMVSRFSTSGLSSILFLDQNGNQITDTNNVTDYYDRATTFTKTAFLNIPSNCKYIAFGLGGYGTANQGTVNFTITDLYCELV